MSDAVRSWWAPRVRSLVGLLFLLVVALPFLLLGVQRIFENALVLETEHVLLAEAAVVGELYRAAIDPAAAAPLGAPATDADRFAPFLPGLDLTTSPLLPPATRRGATSTVTSAAASLTSVLERVLIRNLSGVRILDADGTVLASPLRVAGYSLAHMPEVAAAMDGRYEPALRRRFSDEPAPPLASLSRAADLRVSIAIPVFRDPRAKLGRGAEVIGVVYANRTPLDTTKALWAWRDKLYLPFIVSLLVTLGAVVFLTVTLSLPLSRLRRHAERVASGGPASGYRVGRIAPQEVHVLAEALERMSTQLSARGDYIREFAANAAHELKTPLTSLRGAAELLLESGDAVPAERRERFLQNIQSDAIRMDDLVQRILELARIESTRPDRERIELRGYLSALVERYGRLGHEIDVQIATEQGILHAVPEQFDSLVGNLVDNALRHGAGQPVTVRVTGDAAEVVLEVRDRGPALPPGHLDRVFERFYSTSRGTGGTGLGLAIVRAVAEAHGGQVEARAEDRGATFVVRWPVQADQGTT